MEVRDGDGSAATDCSDVQASKCDSQSFTKLIARVHGGCTHVCTANRTCEQGRCAGAFKLVQAINPASCEIAKVEVVVSASEGFARQCCGATVVQHSVISQTCSCEGLHSTSALIANLIVTAHPSYLNEAVHCHSVVLNAQCAAVASGSTCGGAQRHCAGTASTSQRHGSKLQRLQSTRATTLALPLVTPPGLAAAAMTTSKSCHR